VPVTHRLDIGAVKHFLGSRESRLILRSDSYTAKLLIGSILCSQPSHLGFHHSQQGDLLLLQLQVLCILQDPLLNLHELHLC
jgi:hypothetical protein